MPLAYFVAPPKGRKSVGSIVTCYWAGPLRPRATQTFGPRRRLSTPTNIPINYFLEKKRFIFLFRKSKRALKTSEMWSCSCEHSE